MTLANLLLFAVSVAHSTGPIFGRPPEPPGPRYVVVNPDGTRTEAVDLPGPVRTTTEFKVVLALNMPAVIAGSLLSVAIPHTGCAVDICLSTLFVPFLWYVIGKWLDGHGNPFALAHSRQESRMRTICKVLLRMGAGFFLMISFLGLTSLNHERTAESSFLFVVFLIWSACYLGGSIWTERRTNSSLIGKPLS